MNRIVGLETEYGCLTNNIPVSPGAITRVRDWVFAKDRFGLIDVHQRDWDEPAGNGGFLFNGGRCYVDMGHLEYCTPECVSLIDILRYDRAGDSILMQAVEGLGLSREVSFIRNNVDHYSGATFGCHENYLVRRAAPLTEGNIQSLLTFLTLRLLFASSGRVGATFAAEFRGEANNPGVDNIFQISQRADYINNDLFEWVQFNRAIINTRDEPLADSRKYRRLHLLHGDTNVLPTTLLLKVGTTSLVLDMLEADCMPKLVLSDAVMTFRNLSHQPDGPWIVPMANGHCVSAVELLHKFYEYGRKEFHGRDHETDVLLQIWKETLDGLANNPESLVGKVDWITKRWLFNQFMAEEKLNWSDPWLKSQDLEFHHIDPARSLGRALDRTPEAWQLTAKDIDKATQKPPANTRAAVRSAAMHHVKGLGIEYYIDWEIMGAEARTSLQLLDPFDSSTKQIDPWLRTTTGT
ncbi:MAG: proteasome accessory factor [Verrucomicrobiales bacterium]|nr:proteasome accessory factor [Verrucomicrobiales bacterium]